MKLTLQFHGDSKPSVELVAETSAERAILAFFAEGNDQRWRCSPNYHYRPGGVDSVKLIADSTPTIPQVRDE